MNESKATRYQRLRRRCQAAGIASNAVMLGLVALTPLGSTLAAWSSAAAEFAPLLARPLLSVIVFVPLVVVLCEGAGLPALIYRALRVDPAYGRKPVGLRSWMAGVALGVPAALAAAAIVVVAARWAGEGWWLAAGLITAAVLAFAAGAGPGILARVAPASPLNRTELRERLGKLAAHIGIPVQAIVEWDVDASSGTVAVVSGMGNRRRVFLARDVAREWSDDEVTVVVAHELAHHVHHDLIRALALDALVLCAGFRASDVVLDFARSWADIGDPGSLTALPLVALVAGTVWLLATPLRHAQSRRHERRADLFALERTGHAEAFASAIRRAGARHLVEDEPSSLVKWLYHRHPSIGERLALARIQPRDRLS
jgi:STE24 endopeptidase